MSTETLHDLASFRAALARHPRLMLFKHSPICPISARALEEWQRFRAAEPEAPALLVDVIAERSVARELAAEVGVPHQSPQAILFRDGQAGWDASHGAITAQALSDAWHGS
jgi:bacillithiol system protein YtxJ